MGNGWVEVETSAALVGIQGNRLCYLDTSDVVLRPLARHAFTKQTTGHVKLEYDFDWQRTGAEGTYRVVMQLGDGALMSDAALDSGVGVNLVWGNIGGVHERFGYRVNGTETGLTVMSGAHHITVDADLVAKTYSVSVDGVLVQAGVPFEDAVGLDTVRLLTDGLNETNFAGRCFDNIDLQAAVSFGIAPEITSTAVISGTTWVDYAYDVQATGNPNPTFSLVTAPAGMTIDSATGLISWLPTASGNYPVTVQAGNQHGSDTQSFMLNITNGPIFPCTLAPVEIMPLGDSITKGFGTCSAPDTLLNCTGYRDDLWYWLTDNGYSIDLVGSEGEEFQYLHDYDNNHEGHGGWTANQIRDNIYGSGANWLQTNPADVILLHIGTNDISAGQAVNGIVTEVSQILDRIDQFEQANNREVMVILARIINRSNPSSAQGLATTNFNTLLQGMANSRIAAGDRLIVVDMESALNYPADMFDNTHPNATGYTRMFNVWNNALSPLLPHCPAGAGIYTFPVVIASVGQTYRYDLGASGYPLPNFGLNTAPSGMSINATTGLIEWTPGASGSVPVAVQATNTRERLRRTS